MQHYGDNFIPVVPNNQPLHTADTPFCWDETCPCHDDDSDAIAGLNDAINDGIITIDDAIRIVQGKTV